MYTWISRENDISQRTSNNISCMITNMDDTCTYLDYYIIYAFRKSSYSSSFQVFTSTLFTLLQRVF